MHDAMHCLAAIVFISFVGCFGTSTVVKLMFPHRIDFSDPDQFGHWRRVKT